MNKKVLNMTSRYGTKRVFTLLSENLKQRVVQSDTEFAELRDQLQHTRENYVTNDRFNNAVTNLGAKLDRILEMLSKKPDRDECIEKCVDNRLLTAIKDREV
jgi:ATP:corrinoid adenosyltransferase